MSTVSEIKVDSLTAGLAVLREHTDMTLELGYVRKIGPKNLPVYYPRLKFELRPIGDIMITSIDGGYNRPIYVGPAAGSRYEGVISTFYTRVRQDDGRAQYRVFLNPKKTVN